MNEFGLSVKEDATGRHIEVHRFHLQRGQTAQLRDGKGLPVQVLRGALWITQEGDARDFYVGPGDTFTVGKDGLTVLHALRPTQVCLEGAPLARSRGVRWWQAWRRALANYFAVVGARRIAKSRVYRI